MTYKTPIRLGLIVAALGICASLVPAVRDWEVYWGGDWLFQLRGPRPVPEEVVVVSIGRESSRHFGLPNNPRKWPRSLHARLVDRLSEAGAAVIVFDIHFAEAGDPASDQVLANAIRKAGTVVLFQYLYKETQPLGTDKTRISTEIIMEKKLSTIPALEEAAVALAPFPLPKVPIKVARYWLFTPGVGDTPTLPMAAFQVFSRPVYDALLKPLLIAESEAAVNLDTPLPNETAWAQQLRQLFRNHPELKDKILNRLQAMETTLPPTASAIPRALIDAYSGDDYRLLNFYAPPWNDPHHAILASSPHQPRPRCTRSSRQGRFCRLL